MRHTKDKTERGFQYIDFWDHNGVSCSIQQSSLAEYEPPGTSALWLGIDRIPTGGRHDKIPAQMHLDREAVEFLSKVFARWLETGKLYQERGNK